MSTRSISIRLPNYILGFRLQFQQICNRLCFDCSRFQVYCYHSRVCYHCWQRLKKIHGVRFHNFVFVRRFFVTKPFEADGKSSSWFYCQHFLSSKNKQLTWFLKVSISAGPIQISSVIEIRFLYLLLNFPEWVIMKLFDRLSLLNMSMIMISFFNCNRLSSLVKLVGKTFECEINWGVRWTISTV